jgi:hypothetical protein
MATAPKPKQPATRIEKDSLGTKEIPAHVQIRPQSAYNLMLPTLTTFCHFATSRFN